MVVVLNITAPYSTSGVFWTSYVENTIFLFSKGAEIRTQLGPISAFSFGFGFGTSCDVCIYVPLIRNLSESGCTVF